MPTSAARIGTSNSLIRRLIRLLISSELMPMRFALLSGKPLAQPIQLGAHAAIDETVANLDGRSGYQSRIMPVLHPDLLAEPIGERLLIASSFCVTRVDGGGELDVHDTRCLVGHPLELAPDGGHLRSATVFDQEAQKVLRFRSQLRREPLSQLHPPQRRDSRIGEGRAQQVILYKGVEMGALGKPPIEVEYGFSKLEDPHTDAQS